MNRAAMERGVALLLEGILEGRAGEVADELRRETPRRVAAALEDELLCGYAVDPASCVQAVPLPGASGAVTLEEIPFFSFCAHHLLPFRGVVHVGYLPAGKHAGIGGLARLVDACSRRLTLQEALAAEIADALETALAPRAAVVVVEAEHACLALRGARKEGHRVRVVERRGEIVPELEALALRR